AVALAQVDRDEFADDGDQVGRAQPALARLVDDFEALVQLVAADTTEVVASRVEEQRVDQRPRVLEGWRVAGANAAVKLEQGLLLGLRGLFRNRGRHVAFETTGVVGCEKGEDALIAAEFGFELAQRRVSGTLEFGRVRRFGERLFGVEVLLEGGIVFVTRKQARYIDCAGKDRDWNLSLAVDLDGDNIAVGSFELEPGTPV